MKSFIYTSVFLLILGFLPINGGGFIKKGPFDPVEQLKRTGSGKGLDFTGRDLREAINKLNESPGIYYRLKGISWFLGLAAEKPFIINLENANLQGANLSGTNLMFANLSNAECDENTNFTETRFSNGSVIFTYNAKLTGIKGLEKAILTKALFLKGQLGACLPEQYKGYKKSEFATENDIELHCRK